MKRAAQPLCAAHTKDGRPCPNRAIRGLDFCLAHAPRDGDGWNAPRACSATTRRGKPCKAPAIKDSDPPLCCAHAGRAKPLWPPKQRCTAHVRSPRILGHKICRGRAVPGTDPPRCPAHAGLTTITRDVAIQCSATNRAGRPCGMPAAGGSDPPLCAVHDGRIGFALGHTRTPTRSGRYAVVPSRRFWRQCNRAYEELFGDSAIELSPQQQLLLYRHTIAALLDLVQESRAVDPLECIRHIQAIDIGLHLISSVYGDQRSNDPPPQERDASRPDPPTQPESPSEFRPLLHHP